MKPKESPVPKRRGRGRPTGIAKIAVTIMLPVTTKQQLDAIANQTGMDRGTFVDQALQRHFAQAAPPDFAKRFAHPPKGPHLAEREESLRTVIRAFCVRCICRAINMSPLRALLLPVSLKASHFRR